MNKYDDINNFLLSELNIKSDCEFLINFINTFLYKNLNREKIDNYYKRIPDLFDRIFGISAKTRTIKQNSKNILNEVDLLNSEKSTFLDFEALLNLLLPKSEVTSNFRNLFYSLNSPPDYVPHYTLPTSMVSKSINSLINQKKKDFVLSLEIFSILSKSLDLQRIELDKGVIHLNIFEYFIFILLIVIKEYPNQINHKVILSKINKNFDKSQSGSFRRMFTDKTKETLFQLDYNRSLPYNFYSILFKNILYYLSTSKYINDFNKLKLIVTAVELIWLSDYFMIPSSNYISRSPYEIYSFFFKSNTTVTNSYLFNYENNLSQNVSVPNIILLNCLQNIISTLQRGNLLFNSTFYNKTQVYQLEKDGLLFLLQKPLFYFFKSLFIKFSDGSAHQSEVNLADVAEIWFTYLTPWNQFADGNSNQNMSQNLSYLDEPIKEYIFMNLLFYTELLNDYIIAFSSLNVLNKKELSFLNLVLDLFKIQDGEIVNKFVNLNILEGLSTGKIYNYSSLIEVDHHVKYIGAAKKNLFPFNISENKKYARIIVNNISNWIYKLEGEMNDETRNFMNMLKESQDIIKNLYQINLDENEFLFQSNQKNVITDSNNIYFKKDYDVILQGNPWNRKLSNEENTLLYYLFKYISYCFDYFKSIPIRYDRRGNMESPITNLRFLCNYYNLGSAVIFILIIYVLVKLIIK